MNEFPRTVREQEYSLVERRAPTLGRPVIAELAADDGFAELYPRQQRMAAALVASFVDVFECVAGRDTGTPALVGRRTHVPGARAR